MIRLNTHYAELKDAYLFAGIAQKTRDYLANHPGQKLYRMGIGDVSQPLCPAVIEALHGAVEEQANAATFHGYQPECGAPFFREAVAAHYAARGAALSPEEVFVSSGASDELGDILDLFAPETPAMVLEPAYPAYLDASVIAGRKIIHVPASAENGFLPSPPETNEAALIYLCSPNNPTGAVFDRDALQSWVDYANKTGAVILFDAAYEAKEIKLMCFAEGDAYLFVITEAGRMDIYDLESGERVFSEMCPELGGLSEYAAIHVDRDTENKRLHVFGGESAWLSIDTENWTISARRTGTNYAWLRGSNRLCFSARQDNENRVASVPIRSVSELADWARKELAEYEEQD